MDSNLEIEGFLMPGVGSFVLLNSSKDYLTPLSTMIGFEGLLFKEESFLLKD